MVTARMSRDAAEAAYELLHPLLRLGLASPRQREAFWSLARGCGMDLAAVAKDLGQDPPGEHNTKGMERL
jgi:hypothetical protein